MPDRKSPAHCETPRKFKPTLADLVDRLTVDQIKEVLLEGGRPAYAAEMKDLEHDIEGLIKEKNLTLSPRLLRIVIALAQLNLHIWNCKDRMAATPEEYDRWLKLAHQLNGLRNRMKNLLLEECGEAAPSSRATNVSTDGLGVTISI